MDGRNLPLALNIKADGMAPEIKKVLQKFNHTNYFTFDMSIPELVFQIKQGLHVYTGISDIMPEPVLADKADGIWLDCFYSDWYGADTLDLLVARYKAVCAVSADLHKRDTEKQWTVIRRAECFLTNKITLCTDRPFEAKRFFHDEGDNN
jgi:hypothetical protein